MPDVKTVMTLNFGNINNNTITFRLPWQSQTKKTCSSFTNRRSPVSRPAAVRSQTTYHNKLVDGSETGSRHLKIEVWLFAPIGKPRRW
jgi:hypothetical protein